MSPAPASEVEALLQRWSALVRSAGLTDAESIAGWQGSHGRKRRTVGHMRAVLSRARVTQKACKYCMASRHVTPLLHHANASSCLPQEVNALHGLCSALQKALPK